MIVKLENTPRDYAWGSTTLMAEVLGIASTGAPMAEVWFGTHQGSPARVHGMTGKTLFELRGSKSLGFLLKFLAAELPLSIQVHPSRPKALAGFTRESELGLDIQSSARSYKDENPKSESLVAITEFEVMAGIREEAEAKAALEQLATAVPNNLKTLERLIDRAATDSDSLFSVLLGADSDFDSADLDALTSELAASLTNPEGEEQAFLARLASVFGADRGVLVAVLMKRFTLQPGQALVVPPGTPHSYVSGLGLEIQDNSDNVLRAGLTEKKVDAVEFLDVLDVETSKELQVLEPREILNGLELYPNISEDYCLHRIEVTGENLLADIGLPGDSILVCVAGEIAIGDSLGNREVLRRGEAAYIQNEAKFYSISGSGTGYLGSELS
ncbi:MAG: hypothetical protein RLZ71_238 [Actinomycetota bacterium]|jgi:mannose-6-phosphate isomerase